MKVFISPQTKIGSLFLILTLILLSGLIFALFSVIYGVEIIIEPKTFNTETNFILEINNKDWPEMKIFEKIREAEKEFSPKTEITIEGYAEGEVKIINNSSKGQTLIATTRLLSPEELLFRLTDQVYVPSKGKTKAFIKADKPGKEYEIGPTRFSIPGLSGSLQKLIYAETDLLLTGSSKQSRLVLRSDIEEAKKILKEQLYNNILEEIKKELPEKDLQIITKSEILSEKSDAGENEEKEKFKISLKLKVESLVLNRETLLKIAKDNLEKGVEEDKKLVSYNEESLSCIIDKIDIKKKEALIKVGFRGETTINKASQVLDKEKIRDLTLEEIKEYLESYEEIEKVKIRFFPSFIRKIPKNIEKIKFKLL